MYYLENIRNLIVVVPHWHQNLDPDFLPREIITEKNKVQRFSSTDSKFTQSISHLSALGYVPADIVGEMFDSLPALNVIPHEAKSGLNYFEDTWVGIVGRDSRRSPTFPMDLWNCFDSVLQDLPHTNNAIEGWHHAFEGFRYDHHENLWRCTENLLASIFV